MKKLFFIFLSVFYLFAFIKSSFSQVPGALVNGFIPPLLRSISTIYGPNDFVRDVAVLPDGKMVVGGMFTAYNGKPVNRICRVLANGNLDTSFRVLSGANDWIFMVKRLQSGKILIGGNFTSFQGKAVPGFARLHPNGLLDTTFKIRLTSSSGFPSVSRVKEFANGDLLICGNFTTVNQTPRVYLAKINANGTQVYDFFQNQNPNAGISAFLQLPDGKFIVSGFFSAINGTRYNRIARLLPTGRLDTSFKAKGFHPELLQITQSGEVSISELALDNQNRILVGGKFSNYNDSSRTGIIRIFQNGQLDTSFRKQANPYNFMYTLKVLPDQNIFLGGQFSVFQGKPRPGTVVLHPNGIVNDAYPFGQIAGDYTTKLEILADSSWVLAGRYYPGSLVRLQRNQAFDFRFNPDGYEKAGQCATVTTHANGKCWVTGSFSKVNQRHQARIVRLMPNGSDDSTFSSESFSWLTLNSVLVTANQHFYAAILNGFRANGAPINGLLQLNAAGGWVNMNLGSGFNGFIQTLCEGPEKSVVVGGSFTLFNNQPANRILCLQPNGLPSATLSFGTGFNGNVSKVKRLNDGKWLVLGDFTQYQGQACGNLVRLLSDGSLDLSINRSGISDVDVSEDGSLFLKGFFPFGSGNVKTYLKLKPDGQLDTTFSYDENTGISNPYFRILPDGRILSFGNTSSPATFNSNLCLFRPDGRLDSTFQVNLDGDKSITDLAISSDGNLVVVGNFETVNGTGRSLIAKLYRPETVLSVGPGPRPFHELRIFPNPTAGQLQIQSDSRVEKVELMDASGRSYVLKADPWNRIDLKDYPQGLYHLRVFTHSGPRVLKVLVE